MGRCLGILAVHFRNQKHAAKSSIVSEETVARVVVYICGAHRVRGKRYVDTSRRPEAVQSREKPIARLELSVSLTRSHTQPFILRVSRSVSLSFSPSFVNIRSRGEKNRSFDLPVPASYLPRCSRLYISCPFQLRSQRVLPCSKYEERYNARYTRGQRKHCLTATVPRPPDDKIAESAPLFSCLRSKHTLSARTAKGKGKSRVVGLCLLANRPFRTRIDIDAASHHAVNSLPPGGTVAFLLPCTPCVRYSRDTHDLPDEKRGSRLFTKHSPPKHGG